VPKLTVLKNQHSLSLQQRCDKISKRINLYHLYLRKILSRN